MESYEKIKICGAAWVSGTFHFSSQASIWEKIQAPINGKPQSIGGYSNGCIIGAQPLALKGEGYQVISFIKKSLLWTPAIIKLFKTAWAEIKSSWVTTYLNWRYGNACWWTFFLLVMRAIKQA